MKFKLKTTRTFFEKEEYFEDLIPLGFEFIKKPDPFKSNVFGWKIKGNPTIEINYLEELIKFSKAHYEIIIIDGETIEIYDDCRE